MDVLPMSYVSGLQFVSMTLRFNKNKVVLLGTFIEKPLSYCISSVMFTVFENGNLFKQRS